MNLLLHNSSNTLFKILFRILLLSFRVFKLFYFFIKDLIISKNVGVLNILNWLINFTD